MLEIQGLSQVRVIDLHPYPDTYKVSGGELAEKFNNYFYGLRLCSSRIQTINLENVQVII